MMTWVKVRALAMFYVHYLNIQLKKSFYFLLFAVGFLHSMQAVAQPVKWDSTAVPDVYLSQVELFNALPHSKKDIVFLGNSITFWGKWDALFRTSRIRNRGIGGDITFGVLRRLDEVINGKPAKVFILIGINDLGRNIPDSVILRNCKRMVQRIKTGSPNTRIYLQTLLPTNESFNKLKHLYNKEAHIRNINQELKRISEQENVTWVDLHSHFVDENGRMKKEYTWDGVHLTLAGYRNWAKVLHDGGYIKAKLR
jgi:lysophospholipase L1-like esterase